MACQVHATHSYPTEEKHQEADAQADEAVARTHDVTTEDADDWLTEIDDALGEWAATSAAAQTFVDQFVCKGGE